MVAEVEQEHAQHLLLASTMFSTAVMCGNSSKFWNTMPMRERSFGKLVARSPTETPSTVMVPSLNGSSPLMHLISVLLPEPEGPQITTTSPLAMPIVQSSSTRNGPYHLLTFLSSITGRTFAAGG
jgi:hypothetical protein